MSAVNKPKQRRNRASLVCTNCRQRKIKCDKKKPCTNCIKSSLIHSCAYPHELTQVLPKVVEDSTHLERELTVVPTSQPSCCKNDNINNITGKYDDTSILDQKFEIFKNFIVLQKPSNTQLRPFIFSCYSKNHILSYKFIYSFKYILNRERDLWKSKNIHTSRFKLAELGFNDTAEEDQKILIKSVTELICNNYQAVLERLNYFQSKLNKILFESCIPMGVVQLIFQHYFTLKPTGAEFNPPKKMFEYAIVSLIAAIVEMSNIFSKYDNIEFNFLLPAQNNEFNELAVRLLNASNYRRKRSIFAVYTLLILRLSLMIYGDAQSCGVNMQNSIPLFRSVIGICMDMGIHLDQDKVYYLDNLNENSYLNSISFAKEISVEQLKRLWNHLLLLDAMYFIDSSTAPIIDKRFCHGYYREIYGASGVIEKFVNIIPNIATDLIGCAPTTLNTLVASVSEISKLLSELPQFDSFATVEKHEDQWYIYALKFKVLKLLFAYEFQITSLLDDEHITSNFTDTVLQNEGNKEIIKSLRKECTVKCKLIYILALDIMLKMAKASLSEKFIFYNKGMFSLWIGNSTLAFIDLIVSKDPNKKRISKRGFSTNKQNTFKLPPPPVFDTSKMEEILYNFSGENHSYLLSEFQESCRPDMLVSFLTHVYENMLNFEVLFSDYRFFVMTKCFLFALYFMYSYINFYYDPDFEISSNFDKIRNFTEKIISKFLQQGRLTHLLPPDQIIANIQQTRAGTDTANCMDTRAPSIPISNPNSPAVGWTPDSLVPSPAINSQSQFDDIASSIFNDEGMVSLFKEINDFFNQD